MGENIAKIVLLLIGFGLVLSFAQHGAGGPTKFVRAKLLGRT